MVPTASNEFRASLFRGATRCPGTVRLESEQRRLRFVGGARSSSSSELAPPLEATLPLEGLVCQVTGFDNGTFVLSHPAEPELQLAVDERDFAQHPLLREHPAIAAAGAAQRAKGRRFKVLAAILLGGAVILGGGMLLAALAVLRMLLGWLLG